MKYIYTILAIALLYFVGNDIYKQNTKGTATSTRIACHKTSKVFERTYDETLLKKAQETLRTGEYELTSSIKEAKHMQTQMFQYVKLEDVDKMLKTTIEKKKHADAKAEGKVAIDYYIYENDKADPGKKTKKSKLYAGYLRFTMAYNGKKVYSVQTDFMSLEGKDIPKSVDCAIESFVTAD